MQLDQYLWIVIVGFLFAFLYAFGIGANDVANAFATVVASKSLTLKQAVMIAGVFEFGGAVLLGASVTNTVRNKIFDVKLYEDEPEILLLGMFSALITGTAMLWIATYFGMPVSTTHTIIGSIMGFSIAAKGWDSLNMDVIIKIWISWAASPICTGAVAFVVFGTLKYLVLESAHPFERAYYTFPIVLTVTIGINAFYVLYKGMNNFEFADEIPWYEALGGGLAAGVGVGLIWLIVWGPWARERIERQMAEKEEEQAKLDAEAKMREAKEETNYEEEDEAEEEEEVQNKWNPCMPEESKASSGKSDEDAYRPKRKIAEPIESDDVAFPEEAPEEARNWFQKFGDATYNQDLQQASFEDSARTKEIWDAQEHYDPKAEQLFTYVQVFTSCMDSFAHGANDVANAIAPVSAILLLYHEGTIESKAPVPRWILAYGAAGMVVGLLLYGYKVIISLGYKMTPITPSRGSMAELSSALFVVTASFLEIPVSTTQSQVGAVAGIGLVGGWRNVQWLFFFKVCISWAVVFFTAIVVSMGVFSMFAYTPSLAAPVILPTDEPTVSP